MLTSRHRRSSRIGGFWLASLVVLLVAVVTVGVAIWGPWRDGGGGSSDEASGMTSPTVTEPSASQEERPLVTVRTLPTSASNGATATSTADSEQDVPSVSTPPSPTGESDPAAPSSTGESTPAASPTVSATPARPPADGAVAVTVADRQEAARIVAGLSTADKATSVLMVTGSAAIGTGLLTKQHFGGVILFAPGGAVDGTSRGTPSQVAAVTAGLRKDADGNPTGVPPLIATDQEYGAVQRLKNGFTTFPDAAQLGAIPGPKGPDLARKVAAAAAQEMRAVGVTVDFAPVFGVLPADGSASAIGRYGRSYGSDPARVAAFVAAVVEGYQSGGVVAAFKHFPGIARIADDSHVTLPTLSATCVDWNAHEAIPARAAVDAGALMGMTGHVLMPAVGATKTPTSMDPTIVGQLLKGSGADGCVGLGFDGVAVTDSMQMQPISANYSAAAAAVAALNAGEDLILMSSDPTAAAAGITAAIDKGALSRARLDDAAAAVVALRIASARVPAPPLDSVNSAAHRELAAQAFAARN